MMRMRRTGDRPGGSAELVGLSGAGDTFYCGMASDWRVRLRFL